MTDIFHMRWFGVEISAPFAALLGAVIVLFPRWGVLQWAEADIPWHLLIFSAGAYAGGLALDDTGAAEWAVRMLFGGIDLKGLPFGVAYTLIIAVMMYSHLLTTSKTVRTMIMIPIIITLAKALGWDPVSFALPGGAVHRLGGRPADQRQAQRHPVLHQPVLGGGQLQVRHGDLHHRRGASSWCPRPPGSTGSASRPSFWAVAPMSARCACSPAADPAAPRSRGRASRSARTTPARRCRRRLGRAAPARS